MYNEDSFKEGFDDLEESIQLIKIESDKIIVEDENEHHSCDEPF